MSFMLIMKTVHRSRRQLSIDSRMLSILRHLKDGLAWALKKGVASCDKLRVGACSLRSGDTLIGLPTAVTVVLPLGRGNLLNGSIQVRRGRETNKDSLSSGERRGKSSN